MNKKLKSMISRFNCPKCDSIKSVEHLERPIKCPKCNTEMEQL